MVWVGTTRLLGYSGVGPRMASNFGQPVHGGTTYPVDWHATMSGFPVAAGAWIFDPAGELLVVKPSYKPNWEIPGGVAHEGESPMSPAGGRSWRSWA